MFLAKPVISIHQKEATVTSKVYCSVITHRTKEQKNNETSLKITRSNEFFKIFK